MIRHAEARERGRRARPSGKDSQREDRSSGVTSRGGTRGASGPAAGQARPRASERGAVTSRQRPLVVTRRMRSSVSLGTSGLVGRVWVRNTTPGAGCRRARPRRCRGCPARRPPSGSGTGRCRRCRRRAGGRVPRPSRSMPGQRVPEAGLVAQHVEGHVDVVDLVADHRRERGHRDQQATTPVAASARPGLPVTRVGERSRMPSKIRPTPTPPSTHSAAVVTIR